MRFRVIGNGVLRVKSKDIIRSKGWQRWQQFRRVRAEQGYQVMEAA